MAENNGETKRRLSKQEELTQQLSTQMGQVQLTLMNAVSELALKNQEQHAALMAEMGQLKVHIATNYLDKDEASKQFAPASLVESVQDLRDSARFGARAIFSTVLSAIVGFVSAVALGIVRK